MKQKIGFLRRSHRLIGTLLILPIVAWVITGLFFFIKPGYGDAFAPLEVRRYPLNTTPVPTAPDQLEARLLKTILGTHLLVRTEEGIKHLNAMTGRVWAPPNAEATRRLIDDAIAGNPRYGTIITETDDMVTTDTGVEIHLNWATLSLSQKGNDTARINRMYAIHYLQWTGIASIDRYLGVVGLLLMLWMAISGVRLLFR